MNCTPIRFGFDNQVERSTLTANPPPSTPLDWIKNEYRAKLAAWPNPGSQIVISGTVPKKEIAYYLAMPGTELVGVTEMTLEFFDEGGNTVRTFTIGDNYLTAVKPLGEWRAGIDPYATSNSDIIKTLTVLWFDEFVIYKSFTLTITTSNREIRIRTLNIGTKIQMQTDITFGDEIQFMTEPELERTASGTYLENRQQDRNRMMSIELGFMSDSDRYKLSSMEKELNGRAFIVDAHSNATKWLSDNYRYMGKFTRSLKYNHVHTDIHKTPITIVEV